MGFGKIACQGFPIESLADNPDNSFNQVNTSLSYTFYQLCGHSIFELAFQASSHLAPRNLSSASSPVAWNCVDWPWSGSWCFLCWAWSTGSGSWGSGYWPRHCPWRFHCRPRHRAWSTGSRSCSGSWGGWYWSWHCPWHFRCWSWFGCWSAGVRRWCSGHWSWLGPWCLLCCPWRGCWGAGVR